MNLGKTLSESILWRIQQEFYKYQGKYSWNNSPISEATNNPFIADCYAKMVIHFIRDWITADPEALRHPFYIVELGAGLGCFSFYVIKRLCELIDQFDMQKVTFSFVITDSVQSNLDFCLSHPALEPYVKAGILDFSCFDVINDHHLHVMKQNTALTPADFNNPLIVFANSILNCIPCDYFRMDNGHLMVSYLNMTAQQVNHLYDSTEMRIPDIDYSFKEVKENYYGDQQIDSILLEYKKTLQNGDFLFPIAAIKTMKKLMALSNNRLFLLASDQGVVSTDEFYRLKPPQKIDDVMSLHVNFHAIGQYFKQCAGEYYIQTPREGVKTVLYMKGFNLKDMPETRQTALSCVEGLSAADYFALHTQFKENHKHYTARGIAAQLNFSRWDPHAFIDVSKHLCAIIEKSDVNTINFLSHNVERIATNFYYIPKQHDTLFDVGLFYHAIKDYERAIKYYEKSQQYFGYQFSTYYNKALCQYALGNLIGALANFRSSLEANPDAKTAREWIDYVEKERADGML